jgi:hypothetical protein
MVNPVLALLAAVMSVVAWIEYRKGNNYRFYLVVAAVLGVAALIPLFLPRAPGLPPSQEADAAPAEPRPKDDDVGFKSIFNGKDLDGWHVSAESGHSARSKNQSGGRWVAEDGGKDEGGMILGSQDMPGNGGLLITDKQYGDFEIVLEMKNDFGPDSGLFLRSTEKGQAYQAMIDYHVAGNLMGIYGEGLSGGISVRNFTFLDTPEKIKKDDCPFALPVSPEKWPTFWKHGEWNELRARIVGNPPHITTWIKGVKFMEFEDREKRHPDKGGIALQVHGGGDFTQQFVRYRKLRIKELK